MRKIPDIDSRKSRRKKRSLLRTSKQVFVLLAGALLAVGALSWAELYKDAAGSRSLVLAFTPPIVAPAPRAPETRREDDEPSFDADALEEKLRDVARNRGGSYGAVVLDPASGKSSSVAADDEFGAASIGKLPALITLYKAAAEGKVDLDDEISILPSDVQTYGSGVLQAYPVGTRITLRNCAFFLVNKSDNTAWVMLERHLGATRIQDQLESLGIRDTDYEARTTTPNDVLLMLKTIANPSFTSEKLSKEMLEAMTDTYLEDRIPAGLPSNVRVAHKTGSYGPPDASFGDAAIVFQEDKDEQKKYFIVTLSSDAEEDDARAVMREMSRTAYESISKRQ